MWNDVFMTYLNSPIYTLYNKKADTLSDVCLNIIVLVLKWLSSQQKMLNLED